jgi:hypothetical protein
MRPELSFARHESAAEQDLDPISIDSFGEVPMIRYEHTLNVIRVVNDVGVRATRSHVHPIRIAVAGEALDQALERV